jgi:hypothetical protein
MWQRMVLHNPFASAQMPPDVKIHEAGHIKTSDRWNGVEECKKESLSPLGSSIGLWSDIRGRLYGVDICLDARPLQFSLN